METLRTPNNCTTLFSQTKYIKSWKGRAIAQAVSHWLPTAAAWVRARGWSCGICAGQSGAGAGFLRVLRFPLPIFIPPTAPQSSPSIIWGLYNRPEVVAVPRDLVPPHKIKKSRERWMENVQYQQWWLPDADWTNYHHVTISATAQLQPTAIFFESKTNVGKRDFLACNAM
jgi:hypothetical protein